MPLIGLSAGTLVVSAEGSALGTMACSEVLVQADPSNTAVVFVGSVSNQTIKLSAGGTLTIPTSSLSAVMAKTSAGSATVNWIANSLRF